MCHHTCVRASHADGTGSIPDPRTNHLPFGMRPSVTVQETFYAPTIHGMFDPSCAKTERSSIPSHCLEIKQISHQCHHICVLPIITKKIWNESTQFQASWSSILMYAIAIFEICCLKYVNALELSSHFHLQRYNNLDLVITWFKLKGSMWKSVTWYSCVLVIMPKRIIAS